MSGPEKRSFWSAPTLVEWIVLILVILVLVAVILPTFPIYFDAPAKRNESKAGSPRSHSKP